ncbi:MULTISPECIES: beta-ketoacyl-[acyl-carrier-protein] synthase family protein [Desulfobacula]|uniref:FabB: beta-ketoacyl-acyl-carrier-protein synthase I n=2 Tax=Desulfobacula TaxID=28222 RepID=K0NMY5_DESTT|nr:MULTISPECIES: beta-ketoacyl synthase N-terminal-like domain-containing protein [Desulfobacula]CCK81990.1 FabB: beta-ketoacyl-acyl-carrier-protein synthase I [Desulfobacula toluolica Tol2]SDU43431.1 3-oxoacyl-[acyl-carrier-protein] synthase II [Desulfobacula phenolica]
MRRVVITGTGTISALGNSMDELINSIERKVCGTKQMTTWNKYKGLQSLVGAPAKLPDIKTIPRKMRRSMGRMSLLAVFAANEALKSAKIEKDAITNKRYGCVAGSTMGSAEALNDTFETMLPDHDLTLLTSMSFFKCISHTVSMNLAQYLGITGSIIATSAACASSLQAIGTGFELIRYNKQDIVLCGGAEELHPTVTGSFDILFATSTKFNDNPENTPRPFDKNRDGLVCGEGAGILVLEELEHAKKRGANILAEVLGYNTCGSGSHISQSNKEAMIQCMNSTLSDASLNPENIDFVSAHATATLQGDHEEAAAIYEVFGSRIPVNSLKGYLGHTLGASGAIELAVSIEMMNKGIIYPTLNLDDVDENCSMINHVKTKLKKNINFILKNCFAFGGINASIICKKYEELNE